MVNSSGYWERRPARRWLPLLVGILLLHVNFGKPLLAQDPRSPEIRSRIEEGIEQTILNDFAGAKETYRQLIENYPGHPMGYFYLGAAYQAEILDSERFDHLGEFNRLMDTCIALGDSLKKKNGEEAWILFFEGSAYLYRSFLDSKRKKNWGAFRNASKGASRLERVIELDSTLYDAYLGVGSFKYWKSRKAKLLLWLPFISDEREKGLALVRTAVEKGTFVKLVGRDQWAWILLDRGEIEEALWLALLNHRRYPESRFFLWTLVEIYYRNQQWEEAYVLYDKLLKAVRELPHNNHYNEITCLVRMAEMDYRRGNFLSAAALASEILELKLSEEMRKRTRKKRERALEIKTLSFSEISKLEQQKKSGSVR